MTLSARPLSNPASRLATAWAAIFLFSLLAVGIPTVCAEEEAGEEIETYGQEARPSTSSTAGISGDILKRRGGYIHPYLDVTFLFTDNVFNASENAEGDYAVVASPGVWAAFPRLQRRQAGADSSTATPGGLRMSRGTPEILRHIQLYAGYNYEYTAYADFSDENSSTHRLDASALYSTYFDLSAELSAIYTKSFDPRGTVSVEELARYDSLYVGSVLLYDPGYRFYARGDYSVYKLGYLTEESEFRDRFDTVSSLYGFYRIRPLLSAFIQYSYAVIAYDAWYDSIEQQVYGGVSWEVTGRTKLAAKVGTGIKDFDEDVAEDSRDLVFETQANHVIDSRRSLSLQGKVTTNESNTTLASHSYSKFITAIYSQDIGRSYKGALGLSYTNDSYRYFEGLDREDDSWRATLSVSREFNRWISASAGYSYTIRDSNYPEYGFSNNAVSLTISAKL